MLVVPAPDSSIRGQASAGTQWRSYQRLWIPACAGMTELGQGSWNRKHRRLRPMAALNKQVLLASRPRGAVTEDNFRIVEVPVGKPGPGEVLVKNEWLS